MSFADLQKRTDECNAYRSFLLGQIALCDMDMRECERALAAMRAALENRSPDTAKWRIEGMYNSNDSVNHWFAKLDKAEGVRGLLDAAQESLDKKSYMLSREITRRQAEVTMR